MEEEKLILIYKDQMKSIVLPKTFEKLHQIIFNLFQVSDYYILINIEGKSNIQLQSNQTNNDQYKEIRKQIQPNTKAEIIQLAQEKQISKNLVPNEFYVEFVKNQKVQCCNETNCQLCFGLGTAVFDDKDAEIINEMVKKRLQQKMKIISPQIFQRDDSVISSPEDFLEYHKRTKEAKYSYDLLKNGSFNSVNNIPQKIPRSQKKVVSIKCQNNYSSKILNNLKVTSFANSICMLDVHYKNDGIIDWPDNVWLCCEEGPFGIDQEVKSLKINETNKTTIKIQIPNLKIGQHKLLCSFRDKQQGLNGRIGNPFELVIEVLLDKKNSQQNKNKIKNKREYLIKDIEEELQSMGYDKNQFSGKIQNFFSNCPTDQQTKETFFSKFLFD